MQILNALRQCHTNLFASALWYPNTPAASWLQPQLSGLAEGWLNGFFANINVACNEHASRGEGDSSLASSS